MSEFRIADPFLKRLVYAIGIMGVIAFGFYTFTLLKGPAGFLFRVLTPFLIALVLAYILAPLVIKVQRRLKMGRITGTLFVYLLILLIIFVLLAFLIPMILSELLKLFEALKSAIPFLLNKIAENQYLKIDEELIRAVRERIQGIELDAEKIIDSVLPALKDVATGGFSTLGQVTESLYSGIWSLIGFLSFMVFVGIINFYFILDWERIGPLLRKMIPPERRESTVDVMTKIDRAMGGFLRGQITVAVIVGSLFACSLFAVSFMGFPGLRQFCIIIGLVTMIGGFIPYLGPVMGVTPALLIVLFGGGELWGIKLVTLAMILGLFSLLQAVEGFVLQPKIVGKGAGLHPLAVMLALLFGAQFGLGGMIVAVPLASVVRVLIHEFYWLPIERREAALGKECDEPDGRDGECPRESGGNGNSGSEEEDRQALED